MEILNGTGKPRIVVTYNNASTATIDLPYCGALQERLEEVHNVHTLIDESLEIDRLGYRWSCTLSYRKFAKGATFQLLLPLMSAEIDTIYITPRVDIPARNFMVYWSNRMQVERAGLQGHSGIELQFEGMETLDGITLTDVLASMPVVSADTVTHIADNATIPIALYQ